MPNFEMLRQRMEIAMDWVKGQTPEQLMEQWYEWKERKEMEWELKADQHYASAGR